MVHTSAGNLDPVTPETGILVSRIIFGAMMGGLVTFAVIVAVIGGTPAPTPFIAFVGLGFAAVITVVWFVIPRSLVNAQLRALPAVSGDDLRMRLFAIDRARLIVSLALLEGAGFFNCVCYLTEHQWWSLAVVGVMVLLMSSLFPTLDRFDQWAEDVRRDRSATF